MEGIPKAWMDELNDQCELLGDPDGREAVLSALAWAAWRRGEVEAEALSEMLEMAEAARMWALEDLDTVFPDSERICRWRIMGMSCPRKERDKPERLRKGWAQWNIAVVHADGGASSWLEFDQSRGVGQTDSA